MRACDYCHQLVGKEDVRLGNTIPSFNNVSYQGSLNHYDCWWARSNHNPKAKPQLLPKDYQPKPKINCCSLEDPCRYCERQIEINL